MPQSRLQAARLDYLKLSALVPTTPSSQALALLVPLLVPLRGLASAAGLDRSTVRNAAQYAAQTGTDFAQEFADASLRYPLIFRLVDEESDEEGELAKRALQILRSAWADSLSLAEVLEKDETKVWQLPTLVDRTLDLGFDPALDYEARASDLAPLSAKMAYRFDDDFSRRVAADKLTQVAGDVSPIQAFNYGIQALDTAFFLAPLPPLQAGLLIISVIGSAAEMAESYIKAEAQRLAAGASIDPSRAMSSSPSVLSLVVQAVFLALCIIPVPGAVRELRNLRRAP